LLIDQYCPLDEVIKRVSIFRDQQKKIGREEKPFVVAVCRALYIAKDQDEKLMVLQRRLDVRGNADALAQTPQADNKATIM